MIEDGFHHVTVALTVQHYLRIEVMTCLHLFIVIVVIDFARISVNIFGLVVAVLFVFDVLCHWYRILEFFLYLFGRLRLMVWDLLSAGLAITLDNRR